MDKQNQIVSLKFFDKHPLNQYTFKENSILEPISKVNLLIGQNNSGKSRFLREFFQNDDVQYRFGAIDTNVLSDLLSRLIVELKASVFKDNIVGLGPFQISTFSNFKDAISNFDTIGEDKYTELKNLLTKAMEFPGGGVTTNGQPPPQTNFSYYYRNFKSLLKNYLDKLEQTGIGNYLQGNQLRIYIPIIRGMRPFDDSQKNFYLERTLSDYFNKKLKSTDRIKREIFTGLELYESIKSKLLGEPEEREDIRNFESFLSENFFQNKQITLIPRDKKDTVFIKIGEEQQLPIYNLGDGLQNLIIILYNIILRRDETLFFIEEPDLGMHPGLQRELITKLLKHNKHQFFITSHSNHLLDLTLDYSNISVFHFAKKIKDSEVKFYVETKSNYERQLLHDLGVKNSSVFLANSSIWVEGITDRMYLRCYMNKYLKDNQKKSDQLTQFKEDIDYSFVEYQGSNITHWNFSDELFPDEKIKASILAGNPIVIADGDILKHKERSENLKKMLGDNLIVLKCKEIENLIPESILRKYLNDNYIEDFENLESIKFTDYSAKDFGLGKYLDKKKKQTSKKVFSTDSGTIRNKTNFCNDIVGIMNTEDAWSLPKEIENLCKKIFDHVLESRK